MKARILVGRHAGALRHQPLAHPTNACRSSLGRHELHRRALYGFGNRFGIIEVVLLSLAIGADIFGRHQPGIVAKRCEFAAQVMCADAGFHVDQASRYIGEPRFHLATRPLLPQHDGAARIVAHDVERVLADIDADHGDRGIGCCLRHGVLLVFGAPCQLRWLAGQEHDRTIPLRKWKRATSWRVFAARKRRLHPSGVDGPLSYMVWHTLWVMLY